MRWRVRAQLQNAGKIMLFDIRIIEVRMDGTIYLELGASMPQVERALLERLSGTYGDILFSGPDDTLMLDHVTEFIATRA